jgi:hypothetical protein
VLLCEPFTKAMKRTFFILLSLYIVSFGYSQKNNNIPIKELPEKLSKEPRPVVIELYTDWCDICKIQAKIINKNEIVPVLLYEKFYFSQFNPESRSPVTFNGKTYTFITNGSGGIHELSIELGGKQATYPCWIILSPDYKILYRHNGLLKAGELEKILLKILQ